MAFAFRRAQRAETAVDPEWAASMDAYLRFGRSPLPGRGVVWKATRSRSLHPDSSVPALVDAQPNLPPVRL